MSARMKMNMLMMILVIGAMMVVWPATSLSQIKKGTIPSDVPGKPVPDPNQPPPEQEKPAESPDQPAPTAEPPQGQPGLNTPTTERVPGVPVKRTEILIRIKPESESALKVADREGGEVEVLKGSFPGNVYKIVFYRKEGAAVRDYAAYCGGTKQFDCAYYLWKNESTVVVRLYNTATQQEERIELTGKNGVSGMKTDY